MFDVKKGEQNPLSGYVGAIFLILCSFFLAIGNISSFEFLGVFFSYYDVLFLMVVGCFAVMLIAEYFGRAEYVKNGWIRVRELEKTPSNSYLLRSSIFRFLALFALFYLMYFAVENHFYFQASKFDITQEFFNYLLYIYLIFGVPYIFLTLKYRWSHRYEFNDYGVLLLIFFKSLFNLIYGYLMYRDDLIKSAKVKISNKRIRKVLLVYLVNFFFLTLMVHFLNNQYSGFNRAVDTVFSEQFADMRFFKQYHSVYLILFNLLFIVDVGIAIIGYTVASRWLDNRTRSVDMTMGGWFVAIMCYPPMNSGFSGYFISYTAPETHNVVTSELALMILMALILICFTIYVWATVVLSFKFSNLTHRGIVTTGPYSVIRHPAYATKNLAWWLDNTFVFSNFWAALGMLGWNIVYFLRGLTEERHLNWDKKYREYCKSVKYRFIPKVL